MPYPGQVFEDPEYYEDEEFEEDFEFDPEEFNPFVTVNS